MQLLPGTSNAKKGKEAQMKKNKKGGIEGQGP